MKEVRLDDAFPATPPRFEDGMRHTLNRLEETSMIRKRKATLMLIAALIVVLALAGAAYAVARQSSILTRLFPNGNPSSTADNMVVTPDATVVKDGLTLKMDEYLFDGASVHFGWTVSSALSSPVYSLASYEIDDGGAGEDAVGGSLGGYGSDGVGDGVLAMLGGSVDGMSMPISRSDDAGCAYGERLPIAPVKVTVTVRTFTSVLKPVRCDDLYDDEEPTVRKRADAGEIGVTGDGLCRVESYPIYAEAADAQIQGGADFDTACIAAYEKSGLMKPYATLTLTVEIPVSQVSDSAEGYAPIELTQKTIIVRYVRFSAASTAMEYDIYPQETPPEEGFMDDNLYIVTDGDGNDLTLGLGLNMDADIRTDEQGKPYIHVSLSGNPAARAPGMIRLVPLKSLTDPDHPAPKERNRYAIDHADPATIATIELRN